MAHDQKRGANQGATKEADLHPKSPEHVQGAPSDVEFDQPGKALKRARKRVAWIVEDEIEVRWKRNQSCSRRLLAERHLHVTESTVRKWCDDDKPILLAALALLPEEFAVAVVRKIFAERGIKL